MLNRKILDTNIIVDAFRGYEHAISYLDSIQMPNISILTQLELMKGAQNKTQLGKINTQVSDYFNVVFLNKPIQELGLDLYAKYHLSNNIGIIDSMIGATALYWRIPLMTRNKKHYSFISDLRVEEPY